MKRIYLTIKQFSGGNELYMVTTVLKNHFIKTKRGDTNSVQKSMNTCFYVYTWLLIYLETTGPN